MIWRQLFRKRSINVTLTHRPKLIAVSQNMTLDRAQHSSRRLTFQTYLQTIEVSMSHPGPGLRLNLIRYILSTRSSPTQINSIQYSKRCSRRSASTTKALAVPSIIGIRQTYLTNLKSCNSLLRQTSRMRCQART